MAPCTQIDFVDQVSTVSAIEVLEAPDGLKDEILSADLGELIFYLHSCFDCPPIPLCKLIPYARVRGLRDDVSGLKAAFGKEGYMQEKGAFIVYLWNCRKEKISISDDIKNKWDAIWKDINDEFEQELLKVDLYNSGLSHDVDSMNTHSLVVTHICDKIINTTHICATDHEVYLKGLSEKDQKLIATIWRSYAKGVEPWYPLTRKYLGPLVYDVQITKEFHIRKEKINKTLSEEEKKKEKENNYRDLVQKYCDRMEKGDWLAKILGLKWGANGWATLEKLTMIATHDTPIQSKILWVSLLEADMVNRTAYGLRKSDHTFREWLRREGLFARIYDRASHMVTDFLAVFGGVDLSHYCTLAFYFDEIKHEAQSHIYPKDVELEGRSKDSKKRTLKKDDALRMAAQRLAYSTKLHDLTPWEIEHCPWWIDMKKGQLIRERELRQAMTRDGTGSGSLGPRGGGGQQSAHIEDQTRGGGSCLGKEPIVDSIEDDTVMPDIATFGTLLTRKSYTFVFLTKAPMLSTSLPCDTRCIALAGDDIEITADFRVGCKNLVWSPIHEHMLKAKPDLVPYTRSGKRVAWAANFIFFDVPFGGFHLSAGSVPGWDSLTEDHVRSGVQLSASTLADFGWLLIMASMGGSSLTISCAFYDLSLAIFVS
ncbi:hypothetical protein L7F22_012870 [Adiantum nelumboides]|nr:hypothetical protein [Adiantum nelumboides]